MSHLAGWQDCSSNPLCSHHSCCYHLPCQAVPELHRFLPDAPGLLQAYSSVMYLCCVGDCQDNSCRVQVTAFWMLHLGWIGTQTGIQHHFRLRCPTASRPGLLQTSCFLVNPDRSAWAGKLNQLLRDLGMNQICCTRCIECKACGMMDVLCMSQKSHRMRKHGLPAMSAKTTHSAEQECEILPSAGCWLAQKQDSNCSCAVSLPPDSQTLQYENRTRDRWGSQSPQG